MIDFNMKKLVAKYGSWVRVQVEFYDFLIETASKMTPKGFRETAMYEITAGNFADGEDFYETIIHKLEYIFTTAESAWLEFLRVELEEVE